MMAFYLICTAGCLIGIAVLFLFLNGAKEEYDEVEEFLNNKYYVSGTLLGLITLSFIPILNLFLLIGFICSPIVFEEII